MRALGIQPLSPPPPGSVPVFIPWIQTHQNTISVSAGANQVFSIQWRIQDLNCPRGVPTPKGGHEKLLFGQFPPPPKKTEWKWKKLDPEGARVPGGPLMHWDSTDHPSPTRSPLAVRSREYNQFFFQKRNVWYRRHNGHPSVTGVCGDNCVWFFVWFLSGGEGERL